ncbi:p-loop containing nucleoside triphosphate hydrolase protein [Mycena kentingensis (nom. inval.)]|nr:p-loop containing nucleoside triphosphate hydrolase protein [Mycena kentingensis (nom. inval.)]
MALNLNHATHTYLALTLPPSSAYMQNPATLEQLYPKAAYVGQVGALKDVQLVSVPKTEWESPGMKDKIYDAFKDVVVRVDVQEPKQRAKRGGDEL